MFKRLNYIGSVVIVLTMILTACQPKPAAKVVINFWVTDSQAVEGAPKQAEADAFTKLHPNVTIHYLWDATMDKALASIVTNNSPDLLQLSGPQEIGSWAYSGALQPLDGYFNQSGFDANDILPGLLKETTWNGKVYGLPCCTDMSMLYYNADMFKAAGLDPSKPPTTTEELLDDAAKLTVLNSDGTIKQLGWLPDWAWTHVGGDGSISIRFGAPFFHADGTPGFDDPRWVEVFNFAKSVYDKYGASNIKSFKAGFGGYGTAQDPLCVGKLAMSYDGEWQTGVFQKTCPNVDIRVAPFPYPSKYADLKNNFEMGGTTIVIPAKAPNKAEAWQYLAFIEEPQNIAMFCMAPTTGAISSSQKALALYDTYKGNFPADYKSFIDLALYAKPTVVGASPISDEEFTELSNTEELIYSGQVSVAQGLKDLQAKLMTDYKDKVK